MAENSFKCDVEYMKFWTIQTKNVIDIIQEKGIYQPDFNCSRYLNANKKLNDLYSVILQSFNNINRKDLPGIIYAFMKSQLYSLRFEFLIISFCNTFCHF